MEKKEARIKCSGCGASYKLKIPVTEKPVNFKCKKCGKVLKLKVKSSLPGETKPAPRGDDAFVLETSQLPDSRDYYDRPAPPPKTASFVEGHEFVQAAGVRRPREADRQWMVLDEELIKGPFTKSEVIRMIKAKDISPDSPIRMGERPWLKASELPDFREHFPLGGKKGAAVLDTISLLEGEEPREEGKPSASFIKDLPTVLSYPTTNPIPVAIFAGIAFVGSTSLSLDVLIGLPLSVILWILLYGYLAGVMNLSTISASEPPPAWNFGNVKEMLGAGLGVFLVFLVYSIVPVLLMILAAAYFFQNGEDALGYVFTAGTVVVFAGTLLLIPACLLNLRASGKMAVALHPGKSLDLIKKVGRPYLMLAIISIGLGLACFFVVYGGFFLSLVVDFGFIFSGLLIAAVLAYIHFVWFHLLGMFAGENKQVLA